MAADLNGAAAPTPVCEVVGVSKGYGGVQALAGVDLAIHPGQVHAIVGENGAGKSTLMKILAGAERPDGGELRVRGRRTSLANVEQAGREGIAIVFQELSLFPDLDVLANLFGVHQPSRLGFVARGEMRRRAQPLLDRIGLRVDVDRTVAGLNLGERQLVEITRALLAQSQVLILDEPNSALNASESERLFEVVRDLRGRGVAVIFISHRLEEVFRIADVVSVMRNGRVVETVPCAETTIKQVVTAMIGREPSPAAARVHRRVREGHPLRLEQVSVKGSVEAVDLTIAPGEIVGLAGLDGAGFVTVLDVIFGRRAPDSGTVTLPSGKPGPRNVAAAVRAGVARVPADRVNESVSLEQSIAENVSHVTAGALGRHGFLLRRRRLAERVVRQRDALQIRMASPWSPVKQLSGGNQQKVAVAKWLEADPGVILLDDPTRGVDVGAKEEIYEIVRRFAQEGRVVLMSSSELPEYAQLCDRVLVFYRGRICGELSSEQITDHTLLEAINTGEVS
ncbi:MAG TPA: sugar ABC transporter ATP-binding protein [Conexibacter sp.]|jgi:ABC-type sugar transport system ATPase subunit|nr:sugar ABC transporter ATP-binding protein [Conexibacter sp.]